ncbi:MAG: transporter substrate-binding domain-containing protein [Devosia sp.]
MTVEKNSNGASMSDAGRRAMFRGIGAGAGLGAMSLLAGASMNAAAQGSSTAAGNTGSLIDKWMKTKKAVLGWEFGSPPMQFKDPTTQKPTGYTVEMVTQMMKDLDPAIEIEFVEMPFGQLVPALISGKVEMIEAVTNLPVRALRGWFVGIPAHYATILALMNSGSKITRREQLNDPKVKIAVLQGSSQQAQAAVLFPTAKLVAFPGVPEAVGEVVSGRADCTLQSGYTAINTIKANKGLKPLASPIYIDSNSYMVPEGDIKAYMWITNWLSFQASKGNLRVLWEKWIGVEARKLKLPTQYVGPQGIPVDLT